MKLLFIVASAILGAYLWYDAYQNNINTDGMAKRTVIFAIIGYLITMSETKKEAGYLYLVNSVFPSALCVGVLAMALFAMGVITQPSALIISSLLTLAMMYVTKVISDLIGSQSNEDDTQPRFNTGVSIQLFENKKLANVTYKLLNLFVLFVAFAVFWSFLNKTQDIIETVSTLTAALVLSIGMVLLNHKFKFAAKHDSDKQLGGLFDKLCMIYVILMILATVVMHVFGVEDVHVYYVLSLSLIGLTSVLFGLYVCGYVPKQKEVDQE